jgi:hypothetical protein
MKPIKNRLGILTIILTVSLIALNSSADKVQLQLRLQAGKSYKMQVTADQKIAQQIMGQAQNLEQTIGMGYTFKVKAVAADGAMSVDTEYHSVKFRQTGPMGVIEYDSDNPPATIPPMAIGFSALVGQSFSMVITTDGAVKDIQGVDAMLARMMEKINLPDAQMKAAIEGSLSEQFGDQALKEMMGNMMAIYPGKPVDIGESWTKQFVITKGFPMVLDNTWKLKARKGGVSMIDVVTVVKSNPKAPPTDMTFMKLSYNLTGTQKGTMEVQESTGWVIRSKLNQDLTGQVEVTESTQVPAGTSWPISVNSIITIESSEE